MFSCVPQSPLGTSVTCHPGVTNLSCFMTERDWSNCITSVPEGRKPLGPGEPGASVSPVYCGVVAEGQSTSLLLGESLVP